MTLWSDIQIFKALMRRELKVIYKTLPSACLDSFILLMLNVTLLGYLFPRMGMPSSLIVPLYIGNIIFIIIEKNFATIFSLIFDIKNKGLITYQITLPLSKKWLFSAYILKEIIKTALLTIPLFFIGFFLLGPASATLHLSGSAIAMYGASLLFFSLLFLCIGFWYSADWILKNVWPRRLSPLFCTGCLFFTWHSIASFSPTVSKLLLLNPITYIGEGLRSALLHADVYVPWQVCLTIILCLCPILVGWLSCAIRRRLDCV